MRLIPFSWQFYLIMYKYKYHFSNILRVLCCFLFVGIGFHIVCAQPKTHVDSLKNALINLPQDKHDIEKLGKICAYYAGNNLDSTLKYGEQMRLLCLQFGDKKGMGDLYNYYGVTYIPIRDDSAKLYLERSLKIRQEMGSPRELIEIHTNLCNFYNSNTSESGKALSQIRLAIAFCDDLQQKGEDMTPNLINAYTLLAQCFKSQNLLQDAFLYYEKAEVLLNKCQKEIPEIASFLYEDLGVIMMEHKFYDDALCYFEQAYYHKKKWETSMGKGNILRKIGRIYFFQKDYTKALRYHQQAEKLLIEEKDSSYTGYAWLNLAQDYKELHQPEIALNYATKAYQRGIYREIPGLIIPSATFLAEAYTKQNDFEKALFYTNSLLQAKDNLAKIQNEQVLNDLIAKYELREKDDKIAYLNQENNLKNEVLKAQRMGILAGTAVGILFMILGMVLVVNYRKKLKINQLLSTQKQELQALNQVKDRLFSIISHDLRSPINDLSMFLQLSAEKFQAHKMLPLLSQKVMTIQHLLDNLLQWSLIQMKEVKPLKKHIEVYDWVEEVFDLYKDAAQNQEIVLENQVSANAVAFCDENMLRFVLRNLVGNALKFSPKGKKITISAQETNKNLHLSVQDAGIGMSGATLSALFSHTVHSQQGLRGEKGTGLGLSLCKAYVEKNGGEMIITSKEGFGTKIVIILPN